MGSNQTKEILIKKVSNLTGNELSKQNSIYTDTCSTQRNFYRALQADVRTKHVFYVLCNKHRLQLGLKDITNQETASHVNYYSSTLKEVNMALTFLRASNKVQQLLLELAEEEGKKLYTFTIAYTTRQGSYFATVMALLKNRVVLERASQRGLLSNIDVYLLINSSDWQRDVKCLALLIKPFYFAQKLSKNDRSTVGIVIPRQRNL